MEMSGREGTSLGACCVWRPVSDDVASKLPFGKHGQNDLAYRPIELFFAALPSFL